MKRMRQGEGTRMNGLQIYTITNSNIIWTLIRLRKGDVRHLRRDMVRDTRVDYPWS